MQVCQKQSAVAVALAVALAVAVAPWTPLNRPDSIHMQPLLLHKTVFLGTGSTPTP